jgi:alpha-tubulin suppressor-like RCC1 family protein
VACGEAFNLFRFYDGSVFSAGDNRHGELASGDKAQHKLMNQIWGLENVKQIDAGKRFAAALDYNGDVFVWGDNSENQLMHQDYLDSPYPIKLSGVSNVKEIACGANFGLALRYDGSVIGWGDNTYGQLGLGYKGSISEPMMTLYKNVKHVAAGDRFSLVIGENGRVYGAGSNSFGQLGIKGKNEILFPEEVLKLKDIADLSVKESLAVAISQMGKAFIWGNFNSPGSKPIFEATEIPGINYVKAVIDGNQDLITVSDLSGKYEKKKMYDNFNDFMETIELKSQ